MIQNLKEEGEEKAIVGLLYEYIISMMKKRKKQMLGCLHYCNDTKAQWRGRGKSNYWTVYTTVMINNINEAGEETQMLGCHT
jgi:hypothetical protein